MFPRDFRAAVVVLCAALACDAVRAGYEEPAKPVVEKTYPFHRDGAKWEDVLDWYAKATELKPDVKVKPKGTFKSLSEKDREYTIGEITDLINEALAQQNLLLIPNRKTFAVVSTEGKIDPKLMPVVELADLPKLGRTAILEVRIPLPPEATTEDVLDVLKRYVTPVGEILGVKGKSIIVRDTVDNVMRIRVLLKPL